MLPIRFRGGPLAGQDGWHATDPPQEKVRWGGFVYRRARVQRRDAVRYVYDKRATRQELIERGVPLSMVNEAAGPNLDLERKEREVTVSLYADGWRMTCDGLVVATAPRDEFPPDDLPALKRWVETVMAEA